MFPAPSSPACSPRSRSIAIFLNEAYRPGLYGVAIYYVLGVLYFAIAGRHRLVLSPEEEFALTLGERRRARTGGIRDLEGRAGGDPEGRLRSTSPAVGIIGDSSSHGLGSEFVSLER